VLASEITSFSAAKKEDYIDLHWRTNNETNDRTYELQKSYDGKNFATVATVTSRPGSNQSGDYEYNYVPLPEEKAKLTFRIKTIDNSNTVKYSGLRAVDLGSKENKSGIRLVPNPSSSAFSVILANAVASDWNIELFNIKGQVISHKQVNNSLLNKYTMNERLSSGVYFVLVTNRRNNQKFVERLVIN
jgi:hypothetical protein